VFHETFETVLFQEAQILKIFLQGHLEKSGEIGGSDPVGPVSFQKSRFTPRANRFFRLQG